uniref:Uncharacterized protein n=1 Tax=Zoysia japonica TaxID=309978 RepID=A0A516UX69_9POAL|nr:hypothetical protein [Zoysia japonica]
MIGTHDCTATEGIPARSPPQQGAPPLPIILVILDLCPQVRRSANRVRLSTARCGSFSTNSSESFLPHQSASDSIRFSPIPWRHIGLKNFDGNFSAIRLSHM